jgi:hypothetical protein
VISGTLLTEYEWIKQTGATVRGQGDNAATHDFLRTGSLVYMNLHSSEHEALFMALHKRSSVTDAFFSAHAES